jgi:hypothetical protein
MANSQVGFNNESEVSSYPFMGRCSLVDLSGQALPRWLVADIGLTLPQGPQSPYLHSAYVGSRLLSAVVACDGVPVLVASAMRRRDSVPVSAVMRPLVAGASGSIVFGSAPAGAISEGRYTYGASLADNVTFTPSVVRVARSMPVSDFYRGTSAQSTYASRASGAVTLAGQGDVVVEQDLVTPNNLIVRLTGNHENYLSVCDRQPATTDDTPIGTLNGVAPDSGGTLTIRIVPAGGA